MGMGCVEGRLCVPVMLFITKNAPKTTDLNTLLNFVTKSSDLRAGKGTSIMGRGAGLQAPLHTPHP